MKGYTERALVPPDVRELFEQVRWLYGVLPDLKLSRVSGDRQPEVSCHMLARAFCEAFPQLDFVDGFFAVRGYEHSWLVVRDRQWLIDLYPIAQVGGPVLVDGSRCSPWSKLYLPHALTIETRAGWHEHLQQVLHVVRYMANPGG